MSFKDLDRVMMEGLKQAHEAYAKSFSAKWEHGYSVSNAKGASQWAPIPGPATQPVVVHAYGGGGRGGQGGLTFLCPSCNQPATRFSGPDLTECSKCHTTRMAYVNDLGERVEDHFRSLERKMASGPGIDPGPHKPSPEPTHCACGASFATVKRFDLNYSQGYACGDCIATSSDKTALPDRIRDAREGRDEDPTTWTAGATPGWEWP